MIIRCVQSFGTPSQLVNKLGKYLYKKLDGAYKYETSPNMCDVYVTILYQLPYLQRVPGKGKEYNDVHEMTLNLNITTYGNKIRLNVIELTPDQKTLGHDVFPPEQLTSLEAARDRIFDRVMYRVSKAYKDYEFLI